MHPSWQSFRQMAQCVRDSGEAGHSDWDGQAFATEQDSALDKEGEV